MPKAAPSRPTQRSSTAGKKACNICGGHFRPQVFASHVRKCEREKEEEEGRREYDKEMLDQARAVLAVPSSLRAVTGTPTIYEHSTTTELDTHLDISDNESTAAPTGNIIGIQTQYHPKGGRPTTTRRFDDPSSAPPPSTFHMESEPWLPFFETREDFLLAEVILEGCLGSELSDRLLKIFDTCNAGKGRVTLKNFQQLQTAWERASLKLSPFELSTISVSYKGKELKYAVHHRPLWDWATDLLESPQLASHFHWDAERIFRCYEGSSIRVFNEPWSANAFWDIQSRIPTGANPLCFVLYADKTRLSSFGTAQGYPVIARCANLPSNIRNGNGFGGGRVVGWLPIVKEGPKDRNKPEIATHKRIVWHESFSVIIQSIVTLSKTGCWFECGDGVKRWLFPTVLILSADYEEQAVMSLTRGAASNFPCPVCRVDRDELTDLANTWPLRTAAQSQELVKQARGLTRVSDREALLSSQGLRDIDNVFWRLPHTDPHRALSFDRLHSNNSGLFGYHLWEAFKSRVEGYGRQEAAQVDAQFDAVPRWSGLIHFREVMEVSFTDGTKYEDISKVLIFAAHNIIRRDDRGGWALLRALRSFTIVDLYLSFEEHTQFTIAAGRQELRKFGSIMQEYIDASTLEALAEGKSPKSWNFPKMHALVHSFDDIEAKGASRNYNTKPNEKMHGPLKKSYARRTNFRDVASQILRIEHATFVSVLIRSQIDEIDRLLAKTHNDHNADIDLPIPDEEPPTIERVSATPLSVLPGPELRGKVFFDGHISLHSQQPPATLASFGDNFHLRLARWLTAELEASNVELPGAIAFSPGDHITEYRSMKIIYESKVDQKQYINILHCSPCFRGSERQDCIIVQTTNGILFSRLLLMFTISLTNHSYPVCLVQPFDAPLGPRRAKDRELGLNRVRARRNVTEFIFARTIIRGAPLVQDFERAGDFFVMDVADHTGDLFLRCLESFTV